MTIKFIPAFFAIIFVVFALLQINDPDPVPWTLAYLAASALCFSAFRKKLSRIIAFPSAILFAAAALYQLPREFHGFTGDMDADLNIELARESLGLFICAAGILISYFISEKLKRAGK